MPFEIAIVVDNESDSYTMNGALEDPSSIQ